MQLEQATAALAAVEPESRMLDLAGPDLAGDLGRVHALVIGRGALPVMCALIRRGAACVEEVGLSDHARCVPTVLAIAPRINSPAEAAAAVAQARRALLPGGRLLLRDPTYGGAGDVEALLRSAGLATNGAVPSDSGLVFLARNPEKAPESRA